MLEIRQIRTEKANGRIIRYAELLGLTPKDPVKKAAVEYNPRGLSFDYMLLEGKLRYYLE